MMNTLPRIAFFDFDGTLISQDSFLIILKTGFKKQPWRILFIIFFLPVLVPTAIFKLNKTLAKSCLLWSVTVFRGKKGAIAFMHNTILEIGHSIWFQEAISEFEKLKKNNVEIVIISASGTTWIRALLRSKYKGTRLIIGSKLGFFLGGVVLTSKNCYGKEKLKRIHNMFGENFLWHSAWSDHIADLPMLKKAPMRFLVCPKKTHLDIFEKELGVNKIVNHWTVL